MARDLERRVENLELGTQIAPGLADALKDARERYAAGNPRPRLPDEDLAEMAKTSPLALRILKARQHVEKRRFHDERQETVEAAQDTTSALESTVGGIKAGQPAKQ